MTAVGVQANQVKGLQAADAMSALRRSPWEYAVGLSKHDEAMIHDDFVYIGLHGLHRPETA